MGEKGAMELEECTYMNKNEVFIQLHKMIITYW